ncbi:hypothetical protein [Saccharopolyspora endophytica]|uniref:hypothetical protein n=1 Tax=Saccharopolyspora endophytica TaxID=543886 RepID=UPI001FEBD1C2|nr:hypothetical protein [Saccharopolyspora endophytica]
MSASESRSPSSQIDTDPAKSSTQAAPTRPAGEPTTKTGDTTPATVWPCTTATEAHGPQRWPRSVLDEIMQAFCSVGEKVAFLNATSAELPALHGVLRAHQRRPVDEPGAQGTVDLALAVVPPEPGHAEQSKHLAQQAAAALRAGGMLVVLTHHQLHDQQLMDPTGALVTASQDEDLLYLQHVVTLLAPLKELTRSARPAPDGRPSVHSRVHLDLLVFAQPRQPEPDTHPAARTERAQR